MLREQPPGYLEKKQAWALVTRTIKALDRNSDDRRKLLRRITKELKQVQAIEKRFKTKL